VNVAIISAVAQKAAEDDHVRREDATVHDSARYISAMGRTTTRLRFFSGLC
jgi:hypothetical protein